MSHELQFAAAAVPVPAEVMGIALAPYTLRHELVLLAQRNALLCLPRDQFDTLTKPQQVFALTFAVETCAAHRPRWWLWRWLNRKPDYALAIADFRNYLEAGRCLLPTLSSTSKEDCDAFDLANPGEELGAGRHLGAPTLASLIHYGMADLHLSHDDVMDTPFAYLANLCLAHLEAKGQIFIANQRESEIKAELAQANAEIAVEHAAAVAAWKAAGADEAARRAAYENHPRIGNLFRDDWYAAEETDAARSAVVEKWGFVAEIELAKAKITMKETTPCPD